MFNLTVSAGYPRFMRFNVIALIGKREVFSVLYFFASTLTHAHLYPLKNKLKLGIKIIGDFKLSPSHLSMTPPQELSCHCSVGVARDGVAVCSLSFLA